MARRIKNRWTFAFLAIACTALLGTFLSAAWHASAQTTGVAPTPTATAPAGGGVRYAIVRDSDWLVTGISPNPQTSAPGETAVPIPPGIIVIPSRTYYLDGHFVVIEPERRPGESQAQRIAREAAELASATPTATPSPTPAVATATPTATPTPSGPTVTQQISDLYGQIAVLQGQIEALQQRVGALEAAP